MKTLPTDRERAFTVFEALLTGAVVLFLLAVLMPMLAARRHHASRMDCEINLRVDGIAFRIWEGDNGDKWPMAVPVASGGAKELIAAGDVAACFQVMSNELGSTETLVCPEDEQHVWATDFGGHFSDTNLSYFVGMDAVESDPKAVLMGDANLLWRGRPAGGAIDLRKGAVSWTAERHKGGGYVLLADGSVLWEKRIGLPGSLTNTFFATNQIVVP